ncbi:DNA repair protein RecO [Commensalibacter communis]|uniref:DNA repair protein RecO n=1 Tax=Commensalibacter communis TaxID=2972786 RepID=A0A9W4TP43_9PROT|nr:DNA repair protein RecO [Commensalibacter communis]CAI3925228.1 Recombinational DNA repair protein RecO (RecF pathway) (RecO) (PDB:1U5K) [Commensalibacter communis]CAI3925749.1 Recombinational DNA repair protein RecO (RecF pathway) (RecO) (PDB:1U5K) [Commensalibacter communis]CAI3935583.1 Recombinational DNA repair protein RecO (RecF pathway) (RecO) (PDB:1U5K) [Commensalibacter communis]CAI3936959.1 Recombinational DNA repair protein RecO (RecF pathway) (RecO) (PDB:1U5K) [Commensalibacter co
MLEWSSPSIILSTRNYGETDGIVSLLSLDQGLYRGLVRAMGARKNTSIWQMGNFVAAEWSARLSDQLGHFKGELVRANFASISPFPFAYSILSSICSVAESSLIERQPVPDIARLLFKILTFLSLDPQEAEQKAMPQLLRWEVLLLAELGYGLDFSVCKEYGADRAYWVSPKTGKVVTEEMAGEWKPRLLRLPLLFIDETDEGNHQDWYDGLILTGYFLEKHVFYLKNKPLPNARRLLTEKINQLL